MSRAIDADELIHRIGLIPLEYEHRPAVKLFYSMIEKMPTLTPQNEPLPVLINDEPDREYIDYMCPKCKDIISQRRRGQRMETVYQCKYHDNCGQRVDWTNPQLYRRPLERQEYTP